MFKKISKSISAIFVALLFSLFLIGNTKTFADTTQTGQWGNATWTLDNGALTLSGNVNVPAIGLSTSLSRAGANPSTVTSISFTGPTSGNSSWGALGNFPDLTTISNLNNFSWSGPAEAFFIYDPDLTNIDLQDLNTSNMTDMTSMFEGDSSLKSIDLSNFNTQKVTTMYAMFDGDKGLTSLNVSSFDTSNVGDMGAMFYDTTALTSLDVSNFDTSKVGSMYAMFDSESSLTSLNLSNFNTSNVSSMYAMFEGDSSLTSLNLSSFNTSNVNSMYSMFAGTSSLKALNLSSFDTSNVTDMTYMFEGAGVNQLTLGAKTALNKNNTLYLSNVPTSNGYTGNWQNVGTGTVTDPNGNNIWTSDQLAANYVGGAQADTYVWQPARTISLGTISTFENDPLYTYALATKPLHSYRYYTVLNSDYPYYSDLTQGQDISQNIVSLGDKIGATVYEQKTMPITYTSGPDQGQTQTFAYISFDGNTWYWVDARALNSDIEYGSISLFNGGIDSNTGNKDFYQLVDNSFNPNGQIVYQSEVTQSDFSSFSDPATAMATYNANLDAAAQRWNQALGQTVFVKADGSQPVNLKVYAGTANQDVYMSGQAYVDTALTTYGNNDQADNPLLATFTHEMGHSLGLNHTGGGAYYNDPYTFSDDSDIMWAVMDSDSTGYLYGTQQNITQNDVNAVKLIIQNQNFENPQP